MAVLHAEALWWVILDRHHELQVDALWHVNHKVALQFICIFFLLSHMSISSAGQHVVQRRLQHANCLS